MYLNNNMLDIIPEFLDENNIFIGLDEVGKGCLAGPVVTAGVILPNDFNNELIRDSKKLSEKQRDKAYILIQDNALFISVKASSVKIIDSENITKATFIAMHKCIDAAHQKFGGVIDHILVDGNTFNQYNSTPHTCITKGDNKFTCIAAAAIIAKVERDSYMKRLSEMYPEYDFASNKGYGTKKHIQAIKEHGVIQAHRKLFVRNFI